MAAETSADAYIPVMIALAKLGVLYAWQYLQEFEVKINPNTAQHDKILQQCNSWSSVNPGSKQRIFCASRGILLHRAVLPLVGYWMLLGLAVCLSQIEKGVRVNVA